MKKKQNPETAQLSRTYLPANTPVWIAKVEWIYKINKVIKY